MSSLSFLRAPALLVFGLTAGLAAQNALLLRDEGAGVSSLHLVEDGVATLAIDGARLDPLALVGVPRMARLASQSPRPVDAAGAIVAHVRLPDGSRIWRLRQGGSSRLLRLGPGATIAELASTPVATPFSEHIAVSSDGRFAAVPLEAGGGLAVIDVEAQTHTVLAIANVVPASVRVGGSHAWILDDAAVVHGIDIPTLVSTATPLPLTANEVALAEVAVAADGSRLAIVTEVTPTTRRILTVDASGAVAAAAATPGAYDLPRYDHGLGPFIAVAPDGASVAFRQTTAAPVPFRDVVVRAIGAPLPSTYTSDTFFTDTLNDVGVISFVAPGLLTFLVGERSTEVGVLIESVDAYGAQIAAGGQPGAFQNLTSTSTDTAAPFLLPGELEVLDIALDPRGQRLLWVVDPQGADGELLLSPVGVAAAPVVIMDTLESPPELFVAGETVIATARPDDHLFPNFSTVVELIPPIAVAAPVSLGVIPPGISVDRFAARADGGQIALVVSAGPSAELGVIVDTTSGQAAALAPVPFAWAPTLAYDAAGEIVTALGIPGASIVVSWTGASAGAKVSLPVGNWHPVDVH